jgi:hypothetical protein
MAKFADGVDDTGGKFATGVVDTGGKFVADIGQFLTTLALIPVVHLDLRISLRFFKIRNDPKAILVAWGEDGSCKKT